MKFHDIRRFIRKVFLSATCVFSFLILVFLWARFVEPNRLTVTELKYPVSEWNGTQNRVRVVVAGDFHVRHGDGKKLKKIVDAILDEKPDLVALVGDFAFSSREWRKPSDPHENTLDLPLMSRIFSGLTATGTPVVACLGNHDYGYGAAEIRKMLEDAGISVLEPGTKRLNFGENCEVFLGGVDNSKISTVDPKTIPFPPEDFYGAALFVVHSPDLILDLPKDAGYLLTLAGHTHGGQICFPGRIPFVPHASRIGDQYAHGMFVEDGKDVFVTRGIGESRLPLRLFCPPEIVVIELVPTDKIPESRWHNRAAKPRKIIKESK